MNRGFCWKFGTISWHMSSIPNPCVYLFCSPLSLPMHKTPLDSLSLDTSIYPLYTLQRGKSFLFLCVMTVVNVR